MKKNKEQEAPVCGNCDQYVDRVTLNKRYKRSEMICRLNGKHMNPALKAGCEQKGRGNMYETERLILEAVSDDAIKEVYSFYNDYDLMAGIEPTNNWVAPQTLEQLIEDTKGGAARFIVRLKNDDGTPGEVIGYASIGTNWIARVSDPLLYLGKKWRGQGYGKELLDKLLRIMFYEINARKCSITVFSFNAAAIKVYLAAGFTQEGRLREALYRKGDYYDVVYLGLFKTEYEKLKGGRFV